MTTFAYLYVSYFLYAPVHLVVGELTFPLAVFQNSIRHNLSLHHKFLKVQNDGAGKSSWWTLSKDSNQGPRTPRYIAGAQDTQV